MNFWWYHGEILQLRRWDGVTSIQLVFFSKILELQKLVVRYLERLIDRRSISENQTRLVYVKSEHWNVRELALHKVKHAREMYGWGSALLLQVRHCGRNEKAYGVPLRALEVWHANNRHKI